LDISVIIPIKDGNKTLRLCLDSLSRSEHPPTEVIVVDDCSKEDCSDLVRSYGFKFLRIDRPRDAEFARNKGAEAAKGDILVFTDCDMLVQPDALGRIHKHFSENGYAAVSGVCTPENDDRNLAARYKNLWLFFSYAASPKEFEFWVSSIGAVRRDTFFAVDGFKTDFNNKYGGGDIEFGRRLSRGGWKIRLDTKIQGKHLKHYSFWSLLKNDYSRGKGWFKFAFRERVLPYVIKKFRIANIYPGFIVSVIIAPILLFSLLLVPFLKGSVFFAAFLGMIYLLVNYPLLRFFRRRGGTGFMLKTIPMSFIDHLVAAFGVLRGSISCLFSLMVGSSPELRFRSNIEKGSIKVDKQTKA
jgi:glycosyltransferase involved in cell wall biosynthesis